MTRSEEARPRRILFVCTGNTCRTPMAAAAARREAVRRGVEAEIRSAGTFAAGGQPASGGAMRAAQDRGLDLSGHRSEAVTREALEWADEVYGMTPSHVRVLNTLAGREVATLLTRVLPEDHPARGAPVSDPVGGPDAAYHEALELIEECVARLFDRARGEAGSGPDEVP